MTNKEIIEDLDKKIEEKPIRFHVVNNNEIVSNQLLIMSALKAILTNIEEEKEQLIKRTEV